MGNQLEQRPLELELAGVKQALDDWRRREKPPKPIPAPIWSEAVSLAKRYGVGPVAAGLKLDYAKLKAKLAAAIGSNVGDAALRPIAPTFVELFGTAAIPAPPTTTIERCVLRIESPQGVRVRVDLADIGTAELTALLKELI